MTDYTDARIWAISGIGYGKGRTVEEAVANHDRIQKQNYRDMLNVPVNEIPLMVWEAPEDVDGFVMDNRLRWTFDGKVVREASPELQIRAVRRQDAHWHEWADEIGLEYVTL